MPVNNDDPKMEGYVPLEQFQVADLDRSSRRNRDIPHGKHRQEISIHPDELDFHEIGIANTSYPQIALITNIGYNPVGIKGISVVGDFILASSTFTELKPGEIGEIQISFAPRKLGPITGGVYLDTGDASGEEFIKLKGVGINGGDVPPPEPDFSVDGGTF